MLLNLSERLNLSLEYATNLLYLISIAVKDYEVSRLLHDRDYVEDQVAYLKHMLAVSESDVLLWSISRGKPLAEVLYLISYLKTASCAVPFILNKKFGGETRLRVTEGLSHLPAHYSTQLMKTALEGFSSMGADTLKNIDHMTRFIAENIIYPILRE